MAYKQTIQLGDPRLVAPNAAIKDFNSEKVKQVIRDLRDTMRENQLIGMAAPQIGENLQIFITEPRASKYRGTDQSDELRVYINPKIVNTSKEEVIIYEGCGSVLNAQLFGPVSRPKEVTIEAFDVAGKKYRFRADGILGRVIQHEYDHLEGIQFTEKICDYKKLISVDFYRDNIRSSEDQLKNSLITIKELSYLN